MKQEKQEIYNFKEGLSKVEKVQVVNDFFDCLQLIIDYRKQKDALWASEIEQKDMEISREEYQKALFKLTPFAEVSSFADKEEKKAIKTEFVLGRGLIKNFEASSLLNFMFEANMSKTEKQSKQAIKNMDEMTEEERNKLLKLSTSSIFDTYSVIMDRINEAEDQRLIDPPTADKMRKKVDKIFTEIGIYNLKRALEINKKNKKKIKEREAALIAANEMWANFHADFNVQNPSSDFEM